MTRPNSHSFQSQAIHEYAAMFSEHLREVIEQAADDIAETGGVSLDGLPWRLWDALFQEETRQRAEWMRGQLSAERDERRVRERLGDGYEEWLDEKRAQARELMARWIDRRAADGEG